MVYAALPKSHVRTLVEPCQLAMENGAKRALIPIENRRQFLEVSSDVAERMDPIFYSDAPVVHSMLLAQALSGKPLVSYDGPCDTTFTELYNYSHLAAGSCCDLFNPRGSAALSRSVFPRFQEREQVAPISVLSRLPVDVVDDEDMDLTPRWL